MGNPSLFLRTEQTSCETCEHLAGRGFDEAGVSFITCTKTTDRFRPRWYAWRTGCRAWDKKGPLALPVVTFPRWRDEARAA